MTVLMRWRTRRAVAGRSWQTARNASTTSALVTESRAATLRQTGGWLYAMGDGGRVSAAEVQPGSVPDQMIAPDAGCSPTRRRWSSRRTRPPGSPCALCEVLPLSSGRVSAAVQCVGSDQAGGDCKLNLQERDR